MYAQKSVILSTHTTRSVECGPQRPGSNAGIWVLDDFGFWEGVGFDLGRDDGVSELVDQGGHVFEAGVTRVRNGGFRVGIGDCLFFISGRQQQRQGLDGYPGAGQFSAYYSGL